MKQTATQTALHSVPPSLADLLLGEFGTEALHEALGAEHAELQKYWQSALAEPLSTLAQRTGKQLRSRLLMIAWNIAGGRGSPPDELPAIVEALHLGSLIVDDIEDGSRTRRGGPTLHEQVGIPLALNAGNWLYFLPTRLVARLQLPAARELDLRRAIDLAVLNAHYGQALDLSVRVTDLRQPEVPRVVRACSDLKTGCLMELAARAGAIAAGASHDDSESLGTIGRDLGTVLQMLDDLTSITSEGRYHKGREDIAHARPTWVWAWFAQSTDELTFGRLRMQQQRVLEGEDDPDGVVAALVPRVTALGRSSIEQQLARVVARAEASFGDSPGCSELRHWAVELASYTG